jgi:stringent starvation protein B
VGAPKGAEDVRVRRRSAWIVMDETVRATMKVYVLARGHTNESPFATSNRSVLYVAREKGDWKVFGYEVDQQPFKKKKATNRDDKAKEKQSTSPKDKKKDKKNKNKDKKKNKKKRSGGGNQRGDRS